MKKNALTSVQKTYNEEAEGSKLILSRNKYLSITGKIINILELHCLDKYSTNDSW